MSDDEVLRPVVGNWYKDNEDRIFEVVSFDEGDSYIELQYFDGEIDEMDLDAWESLSIESVAAPEDWSGPFDEMERDDLGYTDMNLPPESLGFSPDDME